jgi:hypothetical protein
MNPFALNDRDRDTIVDAVARGRQRVAGLASNPASFAQVADEIQLDGRRRRQAIWAMTHATGRLPSLFSLSELLILGGGADTPAVDEWGAAAFPSLGCVCMKMPPPGAWMRLTGRPQLGLLGTVVADLSVQVAIELRAAGVPAAIERHVLAIAMQDFIDQAKPTSSDDWLSLVRAAQSIDRERIEDYIAAVAADGPLVPDK